MSLHDRNLFQKSGSVCCGVPDSLSGLVLELHFPVQHHHEDLLHCLFNLHVLHDVGTTQGHAREGKGLFVGSSVLSRVLLSFNGVCFCLAGHIQDWVHDPPLHLDGTYCHLWIHDCWGREPLMLALFFELWGHFLRREDSAQTLLCCGTFRSVVQVLWSFSIWLEAVAIFPQLYMLQTTGEAETINAHYLAALGLYRALYLVNWIYRYYTEGYVDWIVWIAGTIQTLLYADFFYLYVTKWVFPFSLFLSFSLPLFTHFFFSIIFQSHARGEAFPPTLMCVRGQTIKGSSKNLHLLFQNLFFVVPGSFLRRKRK